MAEGYCYVKLSFDIDKSVDKNWKCVNIMLTVSPTFKWKL